MNYIGCYRDTQERDLSGPHTKSSLQNTPEACVNFCLAKSRFNLIACLLRSQTAYYSNMSVSGYLK